MQHTRILAHWASLLFPHAAHPLSREDFLIRYVLDEEYLVEAEIAAEAKAEAEKAEAEQRRLADQRTPLDGGCAGIVDLLAAAGIPLDPRM